jgi:hypothetical protein
MFDVSKLEKLLIRRKEQESRSYQGYPMIGFTENVMVKEDSSQQILWIKFRVISRSIYDD